MNTSSNSQLQATDTSLQWLTFNLNKEVYGLNVLKIQEVQRYDEISPIPGAPHYVLGIINLRGNVISVINTREKFGLEDIPITDDSRIIILESGQQVVGILVDSVSEVMTINSAEITEAPTVNNDDESSKFIDGLHHKDEKLTILVDSDKILNEQEWQDIANL